MDLDGVQDVCDTLGLAYGRLRTSRYGEQVSISCPLALIGRHEDADDSNKSCSVLLDDDGPSYAKCFSGNCQFKGSFFRLVQLVVTAQQPAPPHLVKLIEDLAVTEEDTMEARVTRSCVKVESRQTMARNIVPSCVDERDVLSESEFAPFSRKLPNYAVARGISTECAAVWDLGFDAERGRWVFSVRRSDGKLIGMTGRILPAREAQARLTGYEPTKYHNYGGLNKTRYLYGANTWEKGLPVVIVEGPVDALRTWMALRGRVNVCATLGEGFSKAHRRIVKAAWPPAIYIFADGDSAGRRMAEKIQAEMHDAGMLMLMRCPLHYEEDTGGEPVPFSTDPGQLADSEIVHAFETAQPILDRIRW